MKSVVQRQDNMKRAVTCIAHLLGLRGRCQLGGLFRNFNFAQRLTFLAAVEGTHNAIPYSSSPSGAGVFFPKGVLGFLVIAETALTSFRAGKSSIAGFGPASVQAKDPVRLSCGSSPKERSRIL